MIIYFIGIFFTMSLLGNLVKDKTFKDEILIVISSIIFPITWGWLLAQVMTGEIPINIAINNKKD